MAKAVEIFGGAPIFNGAFAADNALVTFPGLIDEAGVPVAGLLIQTFGATWSRPVTRFYELGANTFYYVAQRPSGDANMARIVGPGKFLLAFYKRFGDVCKAKENTFEIQAVAGCNNEDTLFNYTGGSNPNPSRGNSPGSSGQAYQFRNAVMTSLSINTTAELAIMNETIQMIFTSASVAEGVDINFDNPVSAFDGEG